MTPIIGGMQDWPLRIGTIIDHAARVHGRREVVTRTLEGPIHRTNYATIAARARSCAAALQRAGAGRGDRIGTLAWNTYRHMEVWYAAGGIGGIYHTVNPRLFEEQIAFIINDADDRFLFVDPCFVPLLERLGDRCLAARRLIVLADPEHMPDSTLDLESYETFIGDAADDFRWVPVPEDTPVGLCYTSGTTGRPKGVVYSHRSNVLHAMMVQGQGAFNVGPRATVLPIVPMYHANAWALAFIGPMVGARLVMPGSGMDAVSLCDLMWEEKVTLAAGVPTVWIAVIEELRRRGGKPPTLERIATGGSACPLWIADAFERDYGVDVIHAWGMTEMSPVGTVSALKGDLLDVDMDQRVRLKITQGAPLYGVEIRILDPQGKELPWDGASAGRLQAKGPCVTASYFNGAGGNVLDEDGFFDTGDLATIDEHAFVRITDRTKDVIKSGGEWISSVELENHASGHPEVVEAAAIGIPDDKWGERPLLIVVPKPGSAIDADDVLDYLRPRVARWWMPEGVRFIEEMPHTATGKINKLALRERHGG